jgi:hypothetical protein
MRAYGVFLLVLLIATVNCQTYMGIFDIEFAIVLNGQSASSTTATPASSSSSTTPSTTVPSSTINTISYNLTSVLYDAFETTFGFVTVSAPTLASSSSSQLMMMYDVVYNKTLLNNAGLLNPSNTTFFVQLTNAAATVSSLTQSFSGYTVNSSQTMISMMNTITEAQDAFNSSAWVCSGILCSLTSTCYWNASTYMVSCVDKCMLFTEDDTICTQSPAVGGVFLTGQCAYDSHWQPYCDCGYSTGNVMANFFDGTQCVSSTFIVAMAASAGGVLLLLCIALICVINQQREAIANAYKTEKKYKLASEVPANNNYENGFNHKVDEFTSPTSSSVVSERL